MMRRKDDFSRLELDRDACKWNLDYYRSLLDPATRILVLVKANAYGHGAVEFSSMVQGAGADYLAVALPVEGIELRESGISLPIIVLTSGPDYFNEIIDYSLEPGIPNLYTLKELCRVLERRNIGSFPIHIKLDTGMHRLGFSGEELGELLDFLKTCPLVRVKSIYSHLAASEDGTEDEFTLRQAAEFERNATLLGDALGYRPMWHLLNSAGIERFPQFQYDMVRLGIGAYGISLVPGNHLRPVASLKVKVLQVKELKDPEGTIGYSRKARVAAGGTTIATIPAGYADGLDRRLGCGNASFSIHGKRVPTIGNICMDMCMLDVSGVDNVSAGDTVTVFGTDPSVMEIADRLGTIPYEVLTSVPRRIERVIVDHSSTVGDTEGSM